MNQSGTLLAFIALIQSSFKPFPLRTLSMIVKESFGSNPYWIKSTIISSRHPITSLKTHVPLSIKSLAFPNQTSVPWDNPEIVTNSPKVVGFVNSKIPRTNGVPNSGIPAAPVTSLYFVVSIFNESVDEKIIIVSISFIGIFLTSTPVILSNIFMAVGSTWPRISNFKILSWIWWKSKCVVFHSAFGLLAGYCTGVKSWTSIMAQQRYHLDVVL